MNNTKNTTRPRSNTPIILALLLIAGLAIIAPPTLAAAPGLTAVPAELNVTKAIATMDAAFEEGNWPRASAYAELITQHADKNEIDTDTVPADVWCKWGYSLRKMGKYDEALAAVTIGIEKDPDEATAYLNRGYTYLALGQYQNARIDAEETLRLERDSKTDIASDRAIANDNTSAAAYNIIASGLLGEGDPKNALVAIDTALILRPDHVNYLNTKGVALTQLGKYADAVSVLTRATESEDAYIAPYPDAVPPEENLKTAQRLYDENKAPDALIIIAAVAILAIGAGAILLQRRK
ncbi:tetratricopeptide repeat protein [Methanogenium cariaci]|jgi:tetratricopeptide (TPR) repeat protein